MKHLDLFSGIGGFALVTEIVWPGIEHTFCEIDPFCQEVLKKHWPNAKIYGDINTIKYDEQPFILTAGVPCQPASQAGRREGTKDNRWLWPQTFRVIRQTKPEWCILENVRGLLTLEHGVVFQSLLTELEDCGYQVRVFIIPAVAVGAPHRRDRVWFVAHRNNSGRQYGKSGSRTKTQSKKGTLGRDNSNGTDFNSSSVNVERKRKQQERKKPDGLFNRENTEWRKNWLEVAQRFCGISHGVPYRLDGFAIDETCAIMGYILLLRNNFYGKENSTRTEKILFVLQKATSPQSFSELLRRYGEIQKEKVLRCSVHGESNDERESNTEQVPSKSAKIQRDELRELWHKQATEHSSYQRELERQCSCEFDDIVRELSSPIALAEWEENAKEATDILFNLWQKSGRIGVLHEPLQALQKVWESVTDKEIGSFRRHYYLRDNNRNAALKAAGNAIVPQVAVEILKAIKLCGKIN